MVSIATLTPPNAQLGLHLEVHALLLMTSVKLDFIAKIKFAKWDRPKHVLMIQPQRLCLPAPPGITVITTALLRLVQDHAKRY
jgi:hypothetical protein